ncbi:WD repeat-containing protein on Y chromosome isoform X4 [Denticeps clupeoides]|uniref:WD repeat-containing protein on Y chromosome isoform X4 n=1 Tax=Denticeps clupeoides TaxID=299321 RepID=UPI0010A4D84C|nr:WD repeat-containing protein on Y chromosome-like isoform X4 [Denticeps clupeoides]
MTSWLLRSHLSHSGLMLRVSGNRRPAEAQQAVSPGIKIQRWQTQTHKLPWEMPLDKSCRATSAVGKIEAKATLSFFEVEPATGNADLLRTRVLGHGEPEEGASALDQRGPNVQKLSPEWLEKELLKLEHRRHTLTLGDIKKLSGQQSYSTDPFNGIHKLKRSEFINWLIEQRVSLENLKELKLAFEELQMGGVGSLDFLTFKQVVNRCLNLHYISDAQIQELFMKIDYSGKDRVEWEEFCTYMQLEYTEKEESVLRSKQMSFALPASVKALNHGEPILRIHGTADGTLVTVCEDGAVNYWSPELQIKKSKKVFYERPVNRKPKWATDFTTMPQYNKLIVGTGYQNVLYTARSPVNLQICVHFYSLPLLITVKCLAASHCVFFHRDREIQFYEMSSLEPYCQVNSLETVPLVLDYCYTGQDECTILYGDTQGCVNIILMTSVGETLRTWKKMAKTENVPNIGMDSAVHAANITYIRWKVHEDWVTKMKYFQNFRAIVSSSNHEASALVIGCVLPSMNIEQQLREIKEVCHEGKTKKVHPGVGSPQPRAACDRTIFVVHKGVMTFDLCRKHNLLVTGGMDRLIRMWNPYVPGKPTGLLKGHCTPICYLSISSEDSKIFSVSTDKTVKIWDIMDQTCLFTAHPKASLIHGDISACLYSPLLKSLYVATDSVARLTLRTRPQPHGNSTVSHKEPVLCCGYSEEFRQVVSGTEGSVVKVWDFDTGMQQFEFGEAHGHCAITCLTFDSKGRRLVTGGRDGCLKIWNFNNGQCLKILRRDGECPDICDCTYLKVHNNAFVMSVGWGRKVDIYLDSPEDSHHIQKPQPSWRDDLKKGHREDILCIAKCPPALLATSSYDGEIIVWNLVSGHIHCRFLTPLPKDGGDNGQGVERSVQSMVFLKTRTLRDEFSSAACLISSGPHGCIFWWNILNGGRFIGMFECSKFKQQITKLAVSADDSMLYAADQGGYIYIYEITSFALRPIQKAPKTTNCWRAHIKSITGLQIVDSDQVLLTSSTDCTVRLWSRNGEFIGTFGQLDRWSVHTPSSWKHPGVPYEVLVDPLSMPTHSVLDRERDKAGCSDQDETDDPPTDEALRLTTSELQLDEDRQSKLRHPPLCISDGDIEREISSAFLPAQPGKRLRHEIFKHANKLLHHGSPKACATLKCFDIDDVSSTCKRPDLPLSGSDPVIPGSVQDEPAES